MNQEKGLGIGYLMQLAGHQKRLVLLSAIFSIFSSLCTFVPNVMVYRVLLFLFEGGADVSMAIGYGFTAALAIVGKFVFQVISGTFSHLGAFNTLYNVRAISRHIADISLGFFTGTTMAGAGGCNGIYRSADGTYLCYWAS